MHRKLVSLSLFLLVAASAALLGAADPPQQGAVRLVSGEVISVAAYLTKGLHGEENREAGIFQVETRGLPVGILDEESGEIYVAMLKGSQSAATKLAPLMGKVVNAQGPVYSHGGLHLIEIQIVAEQ